jgi:hypothetical protein
VAFRFSANICRSVASLGILEVVQKTSRQAVSAPSVPLKELLVLVINPDCFRMSTPMPKYKIAFLITRPYLASTWLPGIDIGLLPSSGSTLVSSNCSPFHHLLHTGYLLPGDLVLFWAIDGGVEMIKLLVEYGVDLNAR